MSYNTNKKSSVERKSLPAVTMLKPEIINDVSFKPMMRIPNKPSPHVNVKDLTRPIIIYSKATTHERKGSKSPKATQPSPKASHPKAAKVPIVENKLKVLETYKCSDSSSNSSSSSLLGKPTSVTKKDVAKRKAATTPTVSQSVTMSKTAASSPSTAPYKVAAIIKTDNIIGKMLGRPQTGSMLPNIDTSNLKVVCRIPAYEPSGPPAPKFVMESASTIVTPGTPVYPLSTTVFPLVMGPLPTTNVSTHLSKTSAVPLLQSVTLTQQTPPLLRNVTGAPTQQQAIILQKSISTPTQQINLVQKTIIPTAPVANLQGTTTPAGLNKPMQKTAPPASQNQQKASPKPTIAMSQQNISVQATQTLQQPKQSLRNTTTPTQQKITPQMATTTLMRASVPSPTSTKPTQPKVFIHHTSTTSTQQSTPVQTTTFQVRHNTPLQKTASSTSHKIPLQKASITIKKASTSSAKGAASSKRLTSQKSTTIFKKLIATNSIQKATPGIVPKPKIFIPASALNKPKITPTAAAAQIIVPISIVPKSPPKATSSFPIKQNPGSPVLKKMPPLLTPKKETNVKQVSVSSAPKQVTESFNSKLAPPSCSPKPAATAKLPKPPPVKPKPNDGVTLYAEIMNLLHAFGDAYSPLPATVELMESILKQELGSFVLLCDNMAALGNSKSLGFLEAILVLKSNRMRVFRLYKHFGFKDWCSRKANQVKKAGPTRYYTKEIQEIVKSFNLVDIGPMINISPDELDRVLYETDEMRLAQNRTPKMSSSLKFLKYSQVRAVSFAYKLPIESLHNWFKMHLVAEAKVTKEFMEVFSFLLFELVGEITNIAFSIQAERSLGLIEKLSDPRGINPDTCMSAPYFQKTRKDDDCNLVSEILVQASEMEAKRLTKKGAMGVQQRLTVEEGRLLFTSKSAHCLRPESLSEAYLRYQAETAFPSSSFRTRAERTRRFLLNNPQL